MFKSFNKSEMEFAQLRKISKTWSFWFFEDILDILKRDSVHLYYLTDKSSTDWRGLIYFQKADIFTDLLYVYVNPEYRRQGVGQCLMEEMIDLLKADSDQETLFLEVRISNRNAQLLYETLGMKKSEVKRGYYSNGEDALIYTLKISDSTP